MLPSKDLTSGKLTKAFKITFPLTTKDNGSPSDDLMHDCRRVLLLIEDERHLAAQELYSSVMRRLDDHPGKHQDERKAQRMHVLKRRKIKKINAFQGLAYREILQFLDSHKQALTTLELKAALFRRALIKLNTSDDWILSQAAHGVTTHYRKETDGSLSIKMEGQIEGVPLFDQVAVVREVDLHRTWAPFCTSSSTLKEINKCDTVGWFAIGAPHFGLMRDGAFRAVGCDCMTEDGTFLIVGQGLQDRPDHVPYLEPFLTQGLDEIEFPPKPTRLGCGRMTIRYFSATIHVESPTTCNTKVVANVDPNLPLPQSLLEFVTRKICGVILHKIQGAAKKISKDPVQNPHARRMRESSDFYQGWLLPKFQEFCKLKNWTMPKVAAFDLSEEDQEREFEYELNHEERRATKSDDDGSTSSISPLTITTSHSRNPIVRYLRESEAKAQAKKAHRIKASRQIAENRLKAKHLSEDQSIRLEELKEAKERRMLNNGAPVAVIEVEKVKANRARHSSTFSQLQEHSWETRLAITTSLCCVVTIVLNPDIIWSELLVTLNNHRIPWWSDALLDVCAIAYICFCAFVHFLVCDVALLYAFGSLDIGMKTGKLSKKYYGDTVRYSVAMLSGSIAAFGAGKAIIAVFTRVLVWYSMRAVEVWVNLVKHIAILVGRVCPVALVNFLELSTSFFVTLWHVCTGITNLIFHNLHNMLIKSNKLGTLVEFLFSCIFKVAKALYIRWNTYQAYVREVNENIDSVPCWRRDAIETTRVLLTYTLVFLLSSLILFNASSRANKRINENWHALIRKQSISLKKTETTETFPITSPSERSCGSCRSGDHSVSVIAQPRAPHVSESTQPHLRLQLKEKQT